MTKQNPKISFSTTPVEFGATKPEIKAGDLPSEPARQTRQVVRIPMTVEDEPPVAPGFAETGLMAHNAPGFFATNRRMLSGGAAVLCATLFGFLAVIPLLKSDDAAPIATSELALGTVVVDVELEEAADSATRAASADLTDVRGPANSSLQTSPSAQNMVTVVLAGLKSRDVAGVSESELTPKTIDFFEILPPKTLRVLREDVVAGTYEIEAAKNNGIERLRLSTSNADTTSELVVATLTKAAEEGLVDMVSALRTPVGSIDTDTMIFNIVQRSLLGDQTIESTEAAHEMSRKMFAASDARTTAAGGLRFYTVRSGDSLAYISLQFYGVLDAYARILEANRNTLQSPDKIRVGQRLIIPS